MPTRRTYEERRAYLQGHAAGLEAAVGWLEQQGLRDAAARLQNSLLLRMVKLAMSESFTAPPTGDQNDRPRTEAAP